MEAHTDQIKAHPDVVDVSATVQHENASRHRMLLAALAARPEGYEQLRCLVPITDPRGEVEIPAGCLPIP